MQVIVSTTSAQCADLISLSELWAWLFALSFATLFSFFSVLLTRNTWLSTSPFYKENLYYAFLLSRAVSIL